jgi:hypothetical protein
MLICSINEDKMRQAYVKGITPEQIIGYLSKNLHISVLQRKEKDFEHLKVKGKLHEEVFLPENVKKQILLWHESQVN